MTAARGRAETKYDYHPIGIESIEAAVKEA
jgi:hypothetical protein